MSSCRVVHELSVGGVAIGGTSQLHLGVEVIEDSIFQTKLLLDAVKRNRLTTCARNDCIILQMVVWVERIHCDSGVQLGDSGIEFEM